MMGADKHLSRWAEHFEELLNRPAPANTPDIPGAEEDLPIDCGKATSEAGMLYGLFQKTWEEEEIPSE